MPQPKKPVKRPEPKAHCNWCGKDFKQSNAVYSKGLWGTLTGGIIGKTYCSQKCLSQHQRA